MSEHRKPDGVNVDAPPVHWPLLVARRLRPSVNRSSHGRLLASSRMTRQALVMLALEASLALMVFGIGLRSTRRDASFLIERPALLGRAFLSMNVLMPLFALGLATTFALTPVVSLALVALTLSPVP